MAVIDRFNFGAIVQQELEKYFKQALKDELTEIALKDYIAKIKPIIEQTVDKIIIEDVEHLHDQARLRDDLKVYIKWSEDNEPNRNLSR